MTGRTLVAGSAVVLALSCRSPGTAVTTNLERVAAPTAGDGAAARSGPRAAPRWTNIGLRDGRTLQTGAPLPAPESGRVNSIRVDPRDRSVVYIGGLGGVWKTKNFGPDATWTPMTDSFEDLAVGAIDLDPSHPDTIYAGIGDMVTLFDRPGDGFVARSDDGGATWSAPVRLRAPLPDGKTISASSIRDLRVDPTHPDVVLVATLHGLFRSTDGGRSFALIDLPNGEPPLEDQMWSLAYLGQDHGVSHWAAAGVHPCVGEAQAIERAWEEEAPPPRCRGVQRGDLWRSTDGGATWSSASGARAFPAHQREGGVGPMTLAAGDTSDPGKTVVFVWAAAPSPPVRLVDVFRSTDGARTFVSASGAIPAAVHGCTGVQVAPTSGNVNRAIAVDPGDANHVLIGGAGCAARSLDALSASPTWEDAAGGEGSAAEARTARCGTLPYVHADWHAAVILRDGAVTRTYAGTDGGIFASWDFFEPPLGAACSVSFIEPDRGLPTQLISSLGSGDPEHGTEAAVIVGLQDNGTRMRSEGDGEPWQYVGGGDGSGVAVVSGERGEVFWRGGANASPDRLYCEPGRPRTKHCGERLAWGVAPPLAVAPGEHVLLAPVPTDPRGSVLTAANGRAYRSLAGASADARPSWANITGSLCDPSGKCAGGPFPFRVASLFASPSVPGLYGLGLDDGAAGRCAVTNDGESAAPRWTISSPLPTTAHDRRAAGRSVALPPNVEPGKAPGDVFVCSRQDESPDTAEAPLSGYLYATRDRGATWTSMHGDTLPRTRVHAVRYDPADATGRTLYAATDEGVYRTTDGGAIWARYGEGLPVLSIRDMFVSPRGDLVRVGTFGRGVWELRPGG